MIRRRLLFLALRVVLPIFGGYAITSGFVGLLSVSLYALGMERSEAVLLAAMLSFLVYLAVLIWGFAETRPWALMGGFVLLPVCMFAGTIVLSNAL